MSYLWKKVVLESGSVIVQGLVSDKAKGVTVYVCSIIHSFIYLLLQYMGSIVHNREIRTYISTLILLIKNDLNT